MAIFKTSSILKVLPFKSKAFRKKDQLPQNDNQAAVVKQEDDDTSILPLRPVSLPFILPEHQPALSDQGWTTISHGPNHPLHEKSQALFQASQAFFNLPQLEKEGFKTVEGTEEGWNKVEGEKEFITIRALGNTPSGLKNAAIDFWEEAGKLLNYQLGVIAQSLGLPIETLRKFSEPCGALGDVKTATMLRLFRYEGSEDMNMKTVAEAHKDLGLLSMVIGDTPGLEVFDRHSKFWFPLEKTYKSPAASLLVGRQLELLSNNKYCAGGHKVMSYPSTEDMKASSERRYRYSIVFVLRAHAPVMVDTDELETPITGKFLKPLKGVSAGEMFKNIKAAHYNINAAAEERERQMRQLAEKKP